MYNFSDKSGRRVCLRPELTPSLVRLVLQKGKSIQVPTKWFAVGQCWRYERTTRGRRREHYQWNMDIVGVPGVEAEAELIHAVVAFFKAVGLTHKDVCIKVSNRKLLQVILKELDACIAGWMDGSENILLFVCFNANPKSNPIQSICTQQQQQQQQESEKF